MSRIVLLLALLLIALIAGPAWAQGIFDFAKAACPPTCIGITPTPPLVPSVIPSPVTLPAGGGVPVVITSMSASHISGCFDNGQLCVHHLPVTIDAVNKTATGKWGNVYFVFPLKP
ncbi:MAG: hypothetical protein ABI790_05365 [Betaproteobacteria bacterium]